MKPFRFKLQVVLELRAREEEEARRAFGQATRNFQVLSEQATQAQQKLETNQVSYAELRLKPFTAADIHRAESEMQALSSAMHHALNHQKTAEQKLLEARERYLVAKRQHQALLKLRDKALLQHRQEVAREEERILEDVVNAKWGVAV